MRYCGCSRRAAMMFFLASGVVLSANSIFSATAICQTLTERQKNEPASARAANIAAARQLNQGTSTRAAKDQSQAKGTAAAVNQVPGVKVSAEDLRSPEAAPITGFHPIKKILQPVENLEGMSIKLEQQIMKLEGPIAALNPPMVNLQTKMTNVNDTMGKMQGQLNGVDGQMHGVRSDLAKMRTEISDLKGPILSIQKPLVGVSQPLEAVERQLNLVLLAIVGAVIAIVVGTPISAVLVYRYKDKLFPPHTAAVLPPERELTRH